MNARRVLIRAGLLLFLLGLVTGFFVPVLTNPRAALAGHLEGLMNGTFLMVAGLAWSELQLSRRVGGMLCWLLLVGTYANWIATTASGALGTHKGTPIAGAGFQAGPLVENLVYGALVFVALTMTAGCVGLVVGAWRNRSAV
jgi:hydroxylaminobenzene mutase